MCYFYNINLFSLDSLTKWVSISLCGVCETNVIEDETHFICSCSFYNELRNSLYLIINYTQPEFQSMWVNDKFVYILQKTASSS